MPDHFYVYPSYLKKDLSRTAGRRIPAAQALADLTSEQIVAAARRLGFEAVVEADKQYPREFHTYAGRVKVTKKAGTTKAKFLTAVAAELRRSAPAPGKK